MPYQDPYSDFDAIFDDMRRATLPGWGGGLGGVPRLGAGSGLGDLQANGPRVPRVDLADEGDRYVLTAELPGVRKEDIRLTIRENVIRLRAERDETRETTQPTLGEQAERTLKRGAGRSGGSAARPEATTYLRRERSQMTFDRVIRLPDEVRAEQANARFANGVLHVTLPKTDVEESGGRGIPIE
ncbi:MAG: hypothetical protein QOE90_3728 [Thermoplasmata archaeon]|jgi:HSP20 family protein|nr:hypothetical protein [Thermoplasmata archaeon]